MVKKDKYGVFFVSNKRILKGVYVMEIDEIMEMDVNKLLEMKHEALKEHVLKVLNNVSKLIEEENYHRIFHVTECAGEFEGEDRHYIDFGYSNYTADIMQIVSELQQLEERIY